LTPQTSKFSESKAELIFCIVTYNGAKTLRQTLESILPFADKVVIVEGRFAEFVNVYPTPHSTDDTLQIIAEYQDKYPEVIMLRSYDDLSQLRARDLYLVGTEGDYFIVWDDDWLLNTTSPNKDALKEKLSENDVWAVWLKCPAESTPNGCPTEIAYETNGVLLNLIYKFKKGMQHTAGSAYACPNIDGKLIPVSNRTSAQLPLADFSIHHLAQSLREPYDFSKRLDFNPHTAALMQKAQELAREQKMVCDA